MIDFIKCFMDAFGLTMALLFPYFISNIYSSINGKKSFYFMNKKLLKQRLEKEYLTNNYLNVSMKNIEKIAMRIIKKYKLGMRIIKIYLISIILFYVAFSIVIKMEALENISVFIHILYLLIILRKEYKVKKENTRDTKFVDFFVTYYLFEIFVQNKLISNFENIPDKYILKEIKKEGEKII